LASRFRPAHPAPCLILAVAALMASPAVPGAGVASAQATIEGALGASRAAASAPRAAGGTRAGSTARAAASPTHRRPSVAPPFFAGRPDAKRWT